MFSSVNTLESEIPGGVGINRGLKCSKSNKIRGWNKKFLVRKILQNNRNYRVFQGKSSHLINEGVGIKSSWCKKSPKVNKQGGPTIPDSRVRKGQDRIG